MVEKLQEHRLEPLMAEICSARNTAGIISFGAALAAALAEPMAAANLPLERVYLLGGSGGAEILAKYAEQIVADLVARTITQVAPEAVVTRHEFGPNLADEGLPGYLLRVKYIGDISHEQALADLNERGLRPASHRDFHWGLSRLIPEIEEPVHTLCELDGSFRNGIKYVTRYTKNNMTGILIRKIWPAGTSFFALYKTTPKTTPRL